MPPKSCTHTQQIRTKTDFITTGSFIGIESTHIDVRGTLIKKH